MLIYLHYSDISNQNGSKNNSPPKPELQKASLPFYTQETDVFILHSILYNFFEESLLSDSLKARMHKGGQSTWKSGSHVRPVNRTKFLNNIPSLRGIINCTSVTFLWRFRNGWMAPVKQKDERKLTETDCNKTPWGQHTHQLINTWSTQPHLTRIWASVIKETTHYQAKTDQEHVHPTVDEVLQLTVSFLLSLSQLWIHDNYFKHLHVDYD